MGESSVSSPRGAESGIEALLEAQRAEGHLDSDGGFTVDASRARLKLGRFQLERGEYMARLVQAGVRANCSRIHIWLGGRVRVRYVDPDLSKLSLSLLARGLEEPLSLPSDSAAACLTTGILAGYSGSTSLSWRDSSGAALRIARGEVELGSGAPLNVCEATLVIEGLGLCPAEHEIVRKRCGYSSLPIRLNGEPLPSSWARELSDDLHGVLFRLAEQRIGNSGSSGIGLPELGAAGLALSEGEPPWDAAIAVPLQLSGPNTIRWIRSGVVVRTDTVYDLPCGAVIAACADELKTDFSQSLVCDEAFEARKNGLLERLRALMAAVRDRGDEVRVPVQQGAMESATVVALGGLLATGLVAFIPPVLAATWIVGCCVGGCVAPWLAYNRFLRRADVAARDAALSRVKELLNRAS